MMTSSRKAKEQNKNYTNLAPLISMMIIMIKLVVGSNTMNFHRKPSKIRDKKRNIKSMIIL